MDRAEFDQFADEYDAMHRANVAITGEAPDYFAEYKIRALRRQVPCPIARIVDFGAGVGNSAPHFHRYFAGSELTFADVSQRCLDLGQARFPGLGRPLLIAASAIAAADAEFDLAFSACVFHHIPHAEHVAWLRELRRVVRPAGWLAIFEHNPLNPLTVRAVNTCPFDANARLIGARTLVARCRDAGWESIAVRYHLFFPRMLAALRPLEASLHRLPFGGQYSVVAR
jgi:ubiquinone/menaquinone biosynthesis C-methylase UbiE